MDRVTISGPEWMVTRIIEDMSDIHHWYVIDAGNPECVELATLLEEPEDSV